MRSAHSGGICRNGECGIECGDGNFKHGVAFGIDGQILFAVHDHVIVVWAAPCDLRGHFAVRNGELRGALDCCTAGTALKRDVARIRAVLRDFGLCVACGVLNDRLRVTHADLVVVPRALRADERKVKIFIDTFQRDVKAVDFFRCAVFIGDGIGGRLKPFAFVLLCVLCRTEVQI